MTALILELLVVPPEISDLLPQAFTTDRQPVGTTHLVHRAGTIGVVARMIVECLRATLPITTMLLSTRIIGDTARYSISM